MVEDPDAPSGTFTHWVLYDIPEDARGLEGGTAGASGRVGTQGRNDFGRTGYNGPCPPAGHGDHRYYFILRALDAETLGLGPGASKRDVEHAIKGRVLAEARTMGTFSR